MSSSAFRKTFSVTSKSKSGFKTIDYSLQVSAALFIFIFRQVDSHSFGTLPPHSHPRAHTPRFQISFKDQAVSLIKKEEASLKTYPCNTWRFNQPDHSDDANNSELEVTYGESQITRTLNFQSAAERGMLDTFLAVSELDSFLVAWKLTHESL